MTILFLFKAQRITLDNAAESREKRGHALTYIITRLHVTVSLQLNLCGIMRQRKVTKLEIVTMEGRRELKISICLEFLVACVQPPALQKKNRREGR